MLRLRFAEFILSEAERLSMTGDDAPVVMLSEAKHPIPRYWRVLSSACKAATPCPLSGTAAA